jgi:hypothetical protein
MIATFSLGRIVATPGALRAPESANQSAVIFLARHGARDWGELDREDIRENEYSLAHGFRLLGSYTTAAGEKLWIITEADRSEAGHAARNSEALALRKQPMPALRIWPMGISHRNFPLLKLFDSVPSRTE